MPSSLPSQASARRSWKWAGAVLGLAVLVASLILLPVEEYLRDALDAVAELGMWGPVLFTAIYVIAAVLFIPGSVLTLGAGAVFGLVRGTLIVSAASTLAAACAFLVGRHLAREAIARRVRDKPQFAAIDQAVAQEGWKIVLLTRLSPVFPYNLLNYAFGLTRVPFVHYVLASWVGMIPGTILYVYLGALAKTGVERQGRTPAEWALLAVGLLATITVTVLVTRIARRALSKRIRP